MDIWLVCLLCFIMSVVSFILGFATSLFHTYKDTIGTLRIIRDRGEEKPYIFFEMRDKSIVDAKGYHIVRVEQGEYPIDDPDAPQE